MTQETMKVIVNDDIPAYFKAVKYAGKIIEVATKAKSCDFHDIIGEGYGIKNLYFTKVSEPFQPESGMVFEAVSGKLGIFMRFRGRLIMLFVAPGEGFSSYADFDPKIDLNLTCSRGSSIKKIFEIVSDSPADLLPRHLKFAVGTGRTKLIWERKPESKEIVLQGKGRAVVKSDNAHFVGFGDVSVNELETILATAKSLK